MPKRVSDWVKIAGELRDGFLVVAAICYFFGYIVWAISAYRNGLGLLPALDFQYFVAGAPPLVIILGLYYLIIGFALLGKMTRGWIGTNPKGWKLYLRWTMVGLGMIAFTLIYVNSTEWFGAAFPKLSRSSWFLLVLVLTIIASTFFFSLPEQSARSRHGYPVNDDVERPAASGLRGGVITLDFYLMSLLLIVRAVYVGMIFILLAVIAFGYFFVVYQRLPQEFGGARPQYACLDIVKAQISSETIAGLLPSDPNKSTDTVVRSLKVEVLFSGSDVILVRSQGRVYKIAKSTIQTVTSCN
jgi:hypothetical protein